MTKEIMLTAKSCTEKNGKAKNIRGQGFVPAVIYGPNIGNSNIKIEKLELERTLSSAGESSLIDLIIDNKPAMKVIAKQIQRDIIKDNIIHVDFYQVDMNKRIAIEIPLNFIGKSKAESELGGILVKNIDSIKAECLPGDLVDKIDVDTSGLVAYNDVIKVSDLICPQDITLVNKEDEVIASVVEPRRVEEEKEEEEEVAEEAGDEKEKEKKDGEEDKKTAEEDKKEGGGEKEDEEKK